MPFSLFTRLLLVFTVLAYHSSINAADLPPPTGKVLLTISGDISHHNIDETAQFDQKMLDQFKPTTFKTNTPWTEGLTEFTGVMVSEILSYVGANSSDFRANALDKYWNDIKDIDFDKIPAIIAYKKNGKHLRVRELGPLWLIFPFDDYPEISDEKHKTASVWQLIGIVVN